MNKSEIRKLVFDFKSKCEKNSINFLLGVTIEDGDFAFTTGYGTSQNLKMLSFDITQFVVKKDEKNQHKIK